MKNQEQIVYLEKKSQNKQKTSRRTNVIQINSDPISFALLTVSDGNDKMGEKSIN